MIYDITRCTGDCTTRTRIIYADVLNRAANDPSNFISMEKGSKFLLALSIFCVEAVEAPV